MKNKKDSTALDKAKVAKTPEEYEKEIQEYYNMPGQFNDLYMPSDVIEAGYMNIAKQK